MTALTPFWFALLTGLLCDPVWLPISRSPADIYFVATVTAADSANSDRVRARVLQVGDGAARLRGRDLVLVPWAYGSDCSPLPWGTAAAWRPPLGAAFYTGQLRAGEQDSLPTIDVHMAWREPMWRDRDPRWRTRYPPETC